jgi:hypothetical protein
VSKSGLRCKNHTAKCSIDYDGVDTLVGSFVSTTSINHRIDISAKYNQVFASRFPNGMYFHCGGVNSDHATWKCYLETDISGFKVFEWDGSAIALKWQGEIKIPEEQNTTLALGNANVESLQLEKGSKFTLNAARENATVFFDCVTVKSEALLSVDERVKVVIGGLELHGDIPYPLSVSGNVSFGKSAVLSIPAAWRQVSVPFAIMKFTDGIASIPPTVVLDDGKVLGIRQVYIVDNEVRVNLHPGTCIVVR